MTDNKTEETKVEKNSLETEDSSGSEERKLVYSEEAYRKALQRRQELYAQGLNQEEVDEAMFSEEI